jgi:1,2-phenylacetyl-CoA epoxidase catalytic subunit
LAVVDAPHKRGEHVPEFNQLLSEMTEVRRSEPGAQW